jgi:hypothetical protein
LKKEPKSIIITIHFGEKDGYKKINKEKSFE